MEKNLFAQANINPFTNKSKYFKFFVEILIEVFCLNRKYKKYVKYYSKKEKVT